MQYPADVHFSDEEIVEELSRRGYTNLAPHILQDIKAALNRELDKALSEVARTSPHSNAGGTSVSSLSSLQSRETEKDKKGSKSSQISHGSYTSSSYSQSSFESSSTTSPEKTTLPEDLTFTDDEILAVLHEMGYHDVTLEMLAAVKDELPRAVEDDLESRSVVSSSKTEESSTMNEYSPSGMTDSSGEISDSRHSSNSSSTAITSSTPQDRPVTQRLVKRKVLRYTKSGIPFITEDSVLRSFDFDIRQGTDDQKSTTDQSEQTPVCTTDGKQPKKHSATTHEKSELQRRKNCKSDPVSLYHKYKKCWAAHNIPGERSHKDLRWNLREKMLDYDSVIKVSFPPGRTYNLVL